jgi:hypothetical protein
MGKTGPQREMGYRFDRGIAEQPLGQWPAFAAHDELIPVAGLAELGSHGQPSVPARNGAPSSTGTRSCWAVLLSRGPSLSP